MLPKEIVPSRPSTYVSYSVPQKIKLQVDFFCLRFVPSMMTHPTSIVHLKLQKRQFPKLNQVRAVSRIFEPIFLFPKVTLFPGKTNFELWSVKCDHMDQFIFCWSINALREIWKCCFSSIQFDDISFREKWRKINYFFLPRKGFWPLFYIYEKLLKIIVWRPFSRKKFSDLFANLYEHIVTV